MSLLLVANLLICKFANMRLMDQPLIPECGLID